MPRKLRQLRSELRRKGWHVVRQTGSHERWCHAEVPGYEFTLAGADGADAKRYQEDDVRDADRQLRQARARRKRGQQP